ncbi:MULTISPECIES: LysE family translocator [Anaeromyxobacter]|uniref:LysE family translocator n=1 Tax=Anaeromyxobacter TaxID=161492 RepID=UPI001F58D3AE|nr:MULTISPECIES: LysE family translocator [unclassified Anaeromyxobacter]
MVIPPQKLALFVAATLALTLTPGPAVLFIVARSMSLGRRAGFLSVLGVGLGNTVHAAAAALGLAALLASSPVAFSFVRYLGAAYLVLLGVRRVLDRGGSLGAADAGAAPAAPRSILRQGFLVAALNPKTALFFLAFLPQFADPARASMAAQVLALGLLFVALAVVTDSGYVLVAGGLGGWLRRNPAFARRERYLSGAIYVGLGALSALAR